MTRENERDVRKQLLEERVHIYEILRGLENSRAGEPGEMGFLVSIGLAEGWIKDAFDRLDDELRPISEEEIAQDEVQIERLRHNWAKNTF